MTQTAPPSPEAAPGFHFLRLAEVRRETPDAVSLLFAVPEPLRATFAFKAGQHLTLRRVIEGEDVRRTYSICSAPGDGSLRVAVRHLPGGAMSGFANGTLRTGEWIEVGAPFGRFTFGFEGGRARRYLAIAAGSGITPVLSLIRTALAVEPDSAVTLFYANRGLSTVLFLEELAALKDRHIGRLQVHHFLSREVDEVELFAGRLDRERCERALRLLLPGTPDAVFLCGPAPMMGEARAALAAFGVEPGAIHAERFTVLAPDPAQRAAAEALAATAGAVPMTVTLDGRRVPVAYRPEAGNVLDSVRAAGLPAPYACKGGVCATCRARVVEGEVAMKVNYGLSDEEVAQGFVLTCQAVPRGPVVLDYDV
ncbi:2Fe-2S iron-sulfur cluster-binding protein [Zavarzinia sp. CC-PAN008]|uniref:2Fe-2S iron-sulfur cluster-binding protein n=1 Tax=Zavarzinia sp. CC-PAN008 TaxID=3243332 RepID=UPI003F742878